MEIFNFRVNPELRSRRESAIFDCFVIASNLFLDAVDLIFVDMSVVGDKSELARSCVDDVGDEMTENGILDNVEGKTKRDVRGTRSDKEVQSAVDKIPLRVPDTRGERSSWKPLILPERHNHTAVARIFF